ncbi:MAG TPA: DUF4351 domain-containing protein [Blastocatellia bacterium]|nr:DUF4351 domain-containing protein [Blastocatellia bacterium]HMV87844.1 DUF4351 domain-containing protein [Blastocatellia bacterium]HMZ19922.1 DUF4351 domain-containing protein [Blastocatellia bacterium]HNG32708.1 DUF4351 domain-containing protein [Blastocatellia bacterium]
MNQKQQPESATANVAPDDDQDSAWKDLLHDLFPAFLKFFFLEIARDVDWSRGYVPLDKELAKIRPDLPSGKLYADKLFKVWLKNGKVKWILIHVEIQGHAGRSFARRMFVYNYRIGEEYPGVDVVSLAVITETKGRVINRYEVSNWGCSLVFTFPCVQLADYAERWAQLEADRNPFAVAVMAQLKALETKGDNQRRFVWKRHLIKGLYELGYDRRRIVALLKFMDWAMRLPKEQEKDIQETIFQIEEGKKVPYVTSWERMAKEEGLQAGLQAGLQEGLQEGLQKGLLSSVVLLLSHRFGELSEALQNKLKKLQEEQLRELVVAVLGFETKSDLHNWLRQHAPANSSSRKPAVTRKAR